MTRTNSFSANCKAALIMQAPVLSGLQVQPAPDVAVKEPAGSRRYTNPHGCDARWRGDGTATDAALKGGATRS